MNMPPGGQPPYDPNQPGYGQQPPSDPNQPGYGQQPPPYDPSQGGYGQQPPSYDPNQGGYGQAPPPMGGYAPPQNHPRAVTALVLGILGVVCCSILAPFAWAIGKKAVNEIDASGGRYGGRGQAQAGYILGIIGTVLLILGLLFLILGALTGGLSFSTSSTS
ncbi:MAG: hypothetical protein QOK15_3209 [Nocardioidaceae bacterium]|jgi:hypothetical protein|nr:hypothetical protein [Nocardioidaceae bacterium]